ncbi:MAG TPA: rhodanese-like domain-containing protein [Candidatus Kapabacteria bacterium]|jgi:sulfur-carrier protein adenylyltransferase/sulfurtransferase|nr:rhodanese-like domain-containing protein [Candidatus Kapabacteria bacterium]
MPLKIPFELSVKELKEWMDSGKEFTLVDVREADERAFANIGGTFIPLNTIPEHLSDLNPDTDIVVYCRSGGRSGMAVEFMRRNGLERARNLRGGILAWSKEIDPSVRQY